MQTTEACIEPQDNLLGNFASGCEKTRDLAYEDQIIASITCRGRFGTEITSLLLTGDYRSWYKAQAKSTTKDNGFERHSGFTIEGKFIGENCR